MGGFQGLLDKYPQAVPTNVSAIVVNTTCHWPDRQAFRMLRDVDDDYMPWLGFLLGQTPGSIWYWCADQVGHGLSGSGGTDPGLYLVLVCCPGRSRSTWCWCADQVGHGPSSSGVLTR